MTEHEKLSLVMLRNIQRSIGNVLVMMATTDTNQRADFLAGLQDWLGTFPRISDAVDAAVAAVPEKGVQTPMKTKKKKKKKK